MKKIKVGISSCLLGNNVRYDGSNRLDTFLRDIVGEYIEWIPVCPEVEMSLGVPRESMHLVYRDNSKRLVTVKTGIDHTERMLKYSQKKIRELNKLDLCGFVFKSRSPSSAFKDAKLYSEDGILRGRSPGIFAELFMKANPIIPCEDEERLKRPEIRENFFERVFMMHRLRLLEKDGISKERLIRFHISMKLLIMAHSPKHYSYLERFISNLKKSNPGNVFNGYKKRLMEAMRFHRTRRKNYSVLHHIMGYLKKTLSEKERKELIDTIEQYRDGHYPLIIPITLINHYVKRFRITYLREQVFLNPLPVELRLCNY